MSNLARYMLLTLRFFLVAKGYYKTNQLLLLTPGITALITYFLDWFWMLKQTLSLPFFATNSIICFLET